MANTITEKDILLGTLEYEHKEKSRLQAENISLQRQLTALLSAIAAYANAADDTAEAQAQAALFKLAREIEDGTH